MLYSPVNKGVESLRFCTHSYPQHLSALPRGWGGGPCPGSRVAQNRGQKSLFRGSGGEGVEGTISH